MPSGASTQIHVLTVLGTASCGGQGSAVSALQFYTYPAADRCPKCHQAVLPHVSSFILWGRLVYDEPSRRA